MYGTFTRYGISALTLTVSVLLATPASLAGVIVDRGVTPPSSIVIRTRVNDVHVATSGRPGSARLHDLATLLAANNTDAIERRASIVIQEMPYSSLAHEALGVVYFSRGNLKEAESAFRRATELEPEQAGAWTKLAIVTLAMGNSLDGRAHLDRALTLDNTDRFAHQRLGMLYQQSGSFNRAVAHFRAGLDGVSPDYIGVNVILAELLNAAGSFDDALSLLEPRVSESSMVVAAHLAVAKAYLETGDTEKAARSYLHALSLDPESERATLGLAAVARLRGAYKESLGLALDVLESDPHSVHANLELMGALVALGRDEEAGKAAERAIQLGANAVLVRKRIAADYLTRKNYEAAKGIYAAMIADGIADEDVYGRYAELEFSSGAIEAAETALTAGLVRYPGSVTLYLRRGSFKASLGRYDGSLANFERAYILDPANPMVLRNYSLALLKSGDRSAAQRIAAILYERRGSDLSAGLIYASALRANGHRKAELSLYRELVTAHPESAVALNNYADLLRASGDLRQAEAYARRAVAVSPDSAASLDTLAWTLYSRGETQEAQRLLERATGLAPQRARVHYHYGRVLEVGRRSADAKHAFAKALELAPDADWASDARARYGL